MDNIGVNHQKLSDEILTIITTQLAAIIATAITIRLVFDDTPTKRYARDGSQQTSDGSRARFDYEICCRLPSAVCRLLLERNEAATAMNMLQHSMTELAIWNPPKEELADRYASPLDDGRHRPSRLDRRNFLRRAILLQELNDVRDWNFMPSKIIAILKRIMSLAA